MTFMAGGPDFFVRGVRKKGVVLMREKPVPVLFGKTLLQTAWLMLIVNLHLLYQTNRFIHRLRQYICIKVEAVRLLYLARSAGSVGERNVTAFNNHHYTNFPLGTVVERRSRNFRALCSTLHGERSKFYYYFH